MIHTKHKNPGLSSGVNKKVKSLLERIQAKARARGRAGDDWHPVEGLYDIYIDAKTGGNVEPDLGLALSALKAMLPYVAAPISAANEEPPEPETTADAAKERLKSLLGNKVVSIEDIAQSD